MIEWGEAALISIMILALGQPLISFLFFKSYGDKVLKSIQLSHYFQLFLVFCALATLIYAYCVTDLSVVNVALNSRLEAPLIYKITGVWGNHEGSMILWLFILVFYGAAFALLSKCEKSLTLKTLQIHSFLNGIFSAFVLYTSNPFQRVQIPFLMGQDLNPILQDPALAFHPPTLYMGLVGFSIVFSLAMARLWERPQKDNQLWIVEARFWALGAWGFLTLGISMGSWWAYYELGWGGWWFWDPVENASLMPWLAATALLHVLKCAERDSYYELWALFLCLITFWLCLLGTFLVRSGALSSVHAFVSDPARGFFLSLILIGTIIISGSLFAFRWSQSFKKNDSFTPFVSLTRPAAMMMNAQTILILAFIVVLGTLYPLLNEYITGETMTVGAPYFNATVVPISFLIMIGIGFSDVLPWVRGDMSDIMQSIKQFSRIPFTLVLGSLVFMMATEKQGWRAIVTVSLGVWMVSTTLISCWRREKKSKWNAMFFCHLGLGISVLGMGVDTLGMQEKLIAIQVGENFIFQGYRIQLHSIEHQTLPTYEVERAHLKVEKGKATIQLSPEKRFYSRHESMTTETALHHFWFSNLYVALGGYLPAKDQWTLRIYYHPLVELIWGGGLLMAFGALWGLKLLTRLRHLFTKNKGIVGLILFSLSDNLCHAVQIGERLQNPALEERARSLSAEIKCPVCAGQSIDDSNVDLARHLRVWVRDQIVHGKTDTEIRLILVSTYGESILFKPLINIKNLLLWILPFLGIFLLILRTFYRLRQDAIKINEKRDL